MYSASRQATIIIPLLRQRPDWLEHCVRSALGQSAPCDVVVVQSEETPVSNQRILARMQVGRNDLRVLTVDRACGFACALNAGIEHARTDRVGFLLADDWLEPEAVELCLEVDADIVSSQNRIFEEDGRILVETGNITGAGLAQCQGFHEMADYLGHFLLFKRVKVLEVGGVDPAIGRTGPDDYDLLWVLLENGATAAVVEKCLYNFRDHTEGWRLTLQSASEQLANLERIFDKHKLPSELRPGIRARHGRWYGRSIAQVRLEDRRRAESGKIVDLPLTAEPIQIAKR